MKLKNVYKRFGRNWRKNESGAIHIPYGNLVRFPQTSVSPGTSGLLGWYDFVDNQDSHSSNLDLTESATTPTYTNSGGVTYGSAATTNNVHWTRAQQAGWPNDLSANKAWACRIRWRSAVPTTGIALCRILFRDGIIMEAGPSAQIVIAAAGTGVNSGTLIADQWYTIAASRNSSTGLLTVWVNGSQVGTANPTVNSSGGGWVIGGQTGTADCLNVDFDWLCFYSPKEFSNENAVWFDNGGGTRTYAEL